MDGILKRDYPKWDESNWPVLFYCVVQGISNCFESLNYNLAKAWPFKRKQLCCTLLALCSLGWSSRQPLLKFQGQRWWPTSDSQSCLSTWVCVSPEKPWFLLVHRVAQGSQPSLPRPLCKRRGKCYILRKWGYRAGRRAKNKPRFRKVRGLKSWCIECKRSVRVNYPCKVACTFKRVFEFSFFFNISTQSWVCTLVDGRISSKSPMQS